VEAISRAVAPIDRHGTPLPRCTRGHVHAVHGAVDLTLDQKPAPTRKWGGLR